MTITPVPAPDDNPLRAPVPRADRDRISTLDTTDPQLVRRACARDESYAKAAGTVNLVYALLFTCGALCFLYLTIAHLTGTKNAPWTLRRGWIAYQGNICLMAILAMSAGLGLRRLEAWALPVEAAFILTFLIEWTLSIAASSRPTGLAAFVGEVLLRAAFLAPLINLWDMRHSLVFSEPYRRAVAATPGVRIPAKLSWQLKLAMLVLFVLGTTILAFAIAV